MNKEQLIKQFEQAVMQYDMPENFEIRIAVVEMFIRNGNTKKHFNLVMLGSDKEYNDVFMEAMKARANMQHDVKQEGFYA